MCISPVFCQRKLTEGTTKNNVADDIYRPEINVIKMSKEISYLRAPKLKLERRKHTARFYSRDWIVS